MTPPAATQQFTISDAERAPRFWIAFGWAAHGLLAVTVYYVFWYLKGPDVPPPPASTSDILIDVLLALQFAVAHSGLLLPSVRDRLTRYIPSPAYGVFFCSCTCMSLLTAIAFWRPCGGAVWNLSGPAKIAMQAAYFGAWAGLFYSLKFSGYGYQTGWTTWRPWVKGRPLPTREFRPCGPFQRIRHPVYLSFLGLTWFTPCMTYDRAALTAVWTAYIFFGSYLKDRRLLYYLGDRYRAYQSQVPGFPGMLIGPLGRVRWNSPRDAVLVPAASAQHSQESSRVSA